MGGRRRSEGLIKTLLDGEKTLSFCSQTIFRGDDYELTTPSPNDGTVTSVSERLESGHSMHARSRGGGEEED